MNNVDKDNNFEKANNENILKYLIRFLFIMKYIIIQIILYLLEKIISFLFSHVIIIFNRNSY